VIICGLKYPRNPQFQAYSNQKIIGFTLNAMASIPYHAAATRQSAANIIAGCCHPVAGGCILLLGVRKPAT
jgi:hypothetical protein